MDNKKQKLAFEPPTVRIIYVGATAGMCQTASPNNYTIPNIVEEEGSWDA